MTVAELRKLKRQYAYEMGVLRKLQLRFRDGCSERDMGRVERQRREVAKVEALLRTSTEPLAKAVREGAG